MTDSPQILRTIGKTLAELLVNSAKAMSEAMMGGQINQNGEPFSQSLDVRAVDEESLLVQWLMQLQEIIYMENVCINAVTIKKCDSAQVVAEVSGFHVDSFAQELGEILLDETTVRQVDKGFEATICFDM